MTALTPEPDAPAEPDTADTEQAAGTPDEETAAAVRRALLANGADAATQAMRMLGIPDQN